MPQWHLGKTREKVKRSERDKASLRDCLNQTLLTIFVFLWPCLGSLWSESWPHGLRTAWLRQIILLQRIRVINCIQELLWALQVASIKYQTQVDYFDMNYMTMPFSYEDQNRSVILDWGTLGALVQVGDWLSWDDPWVREQSNGH